MELTGKVYGVDELENGNIAELISMLLGTTGF